MLLSKYTLEISSHDDQLRHIDLRFDSGLHRYLVTLSVTSHRIGSTRRVGVSRVHSQVVIPEEGISHLYSADESDLTRWQSGVAGGRVGPRLLLVPREV